MAVQIMVYMICIMLVKTGLNSPVIRNRHLSCAVLEKWKEKTGLSLKELSEDLFEVVNNIREIEVDEKLKDRLMKS